MKIGDVVQDTPYVRHHTKANVFGRNKISLINVTINQLKAIL